MTLMQFFLEYTIEHACHGNRSECARRLGLEYPDFRRYRKRILSGCGSYRVNEALMNMYCREGLSVDEVIISYKEAVLQKESVEENICRQKAISMYAAINESMIKAQKTDQLISSARSFCEELERSFCKGDCRYRWNYSDDCPPRKFFAYLEWLFLEQKKEPKGNRSEENKQCREKRDL